MYSLVAYCITFCRRNHVTESHPSVLLLFLIHTEIAEHFQYGKQEDAHEFLRYILDTMQHCCLPENMSVIPHSEAEDICTITR